MRTWHANNSRLPSKDDAWQRFANKIHESINLARHVDVRSTGGFSMSILMNVQATADAVEGRNKHEMINDWSLIGFRLLAARDNVD